MGNNKLVYELWNCSNTSPAKQFFAAGPCETLTHQILRTKTTSGEYLTLMKNLSGFMMFHLLDKI